MCAAQLFAAPAATAGDAPPKPAIIERCETCHGEDGNSLHFEFPRLAGQQKDYLVKQIRDIKSGSRKVDVMVPVVSLLKDEQIEEVAAYFASIPLQQGTARDTQKAAIGRRLFDAGVPYKMVAQCSACHGTYAEGRVDPGLVEEGFGGFPSLNGQHAEYIVKQLKAFRDGTRANDFANMMQNLAKYMSDEEMEYVAEYVQGMDLPKEEVAEDVAAGPAPPQAAMCIGCHGPDGHSLVPIYPKLAGQRKGYLLKQLEDIKTGRRKVPTMAKLVENMTDEDREVLAAYFAAQEPRRTPSQADEETKKLGMALYFDGTGGAMACYTCHNFDGRGVDDYGLSPGGYPMLYGQHADYLRAQLKNFKSDKRSNDFERAMHNIAKDLDKDEINALAEYLMDMQIE